MENRKKKEIENLAVKRFVYYSRNHQYAETTRLSGVKEIIPEVIEKARWGCMKDHMIDKWHEAKGDLIKLYFELDSGNQRVMNEWIQENYKGVRE